MPTSAPEGEALEVDEPILQIGSTLGGYRLVKQLGAGGMGAVFLAEDDRLQRKVALKVMKPEVAARKSSKERFLREARAAARVEHDHIIPILQIGEEKGVPFIAMPFLKGMPLDERIKRGRLAIPEVVQIGRQTAEALDAAHKQGMIHRDIKPANIWLETQGDGTAFRVKVLDFGLARLSGEEGQLTQSGAVMGTPAYMAPEQARGRPVDARADLFSLGVVLYEMATGKRPFTGSDTMAILSSLAMDNPPPPIQLNRELPPALSALVERLLAKDPERRVGAAKEVVDSLRKLMPESTVVVVATPRPIVEDVSPWADIDASSMTNVVSPVSRDAESSERNAGKRPRKSDEPVGGQKPALRSADSASRPAPEHGRSKKPLLIGVALGFVALAVAVIVIIRDKDGNKVAEINVPKGGTVEVKNDSDPVVRNPVDPGVRPGDYALAFDGKTCQVTIPTLSRTDKEPWTIEAYITPGQVKTQNVVHVGGDYPFQLAQLMDAWKTHGATVTGGFTYASRYKAAQVGERVHVAATADPAALFIDGRRVNYSAGAFKNAGSKPGTVIGGPTSFEEGKYPFDFFEGVIDELRISKGRRYTTDFSPAKRFEPDGDTLALYHMDEGKGSVLKDSSGNGHHGKIVGAKWVKVKPLPVEPAPNDSPFALALDGKGEVRLEQQHQDVAYSEPFTLEAYVTPNRERPAQAFGFFRKVWADHVGPSWTIGGVAAGVKTVTGIKAVAGARTHVALASDGKQLRLYVDGRLAATCAVADTPLNPEQKWGFGIYRFDGLIHQARASRIDRYSKDFTPPKTLALDRDTVILYRFDEGQGDIAKDSSGNGYHGKIVGAKWVKADLAPVPAVVPQPFALQFDGQQQLVQMKSLKLSKTEPITLEAYATPEPKLASDSRKYVPVVGVRGRCMIGLGDSNHADLWNFETLGSNALYGPTEPGRKRRHLAAVRTADKTLFFVDGKLVDQSPFDPLAPDRKDGAMFVIGGPFFKGTIEQVRVSQVARYDMDFTPAAHFDADANTLALYRFDEGKGDELKDASGNGHHGHIAGAKWVKADAAVGETLLFNGKDLTGWKPVGNAKWEVADGVLSTVGGGNGWLMSEKEFSDVEVTLEYRLAEKANSGLFLRAWPEGATNGGQFMEIQIVDDTVTSNSGQKTGALFQALPPKEPANAPPGEWHRLKVVAVGRNVKVWINDRLLTDANLDDYKTKFKAVPGLERASGRIGLQHYGSKAEFRNIEVREISPRADAGQSGAAKE